jgi:hypothetical protein
MEQKFMIFGLAIGVLLVLALFYGTNLGQSTVLFAAPTNGTIVATPFPVDAWGSAGWGNCVTNDGGVTKVNAFCKCKGYRGIYNNGTGACYEEWKNQRWTWSIGNTTSSCVIAGRATNAGLAVTKVKCI